MTTQASVIIGFFDHPEHCNDKSEDCNFLLKGYCVLRIVAPQAKLGMNKYLKLDNFGSFAVKDPSCKFIWEKSKRPQ